MNTKIFNALLGLVFLVLPMVSQAWWNDDWMYRKQITLDTTASGANITEQQENVPVLVRLHTGNFGYFLDIQSQGQDIRFIAADDVTPLKFHIEKFDPINEMALIWVQVPRLEAASKANTFWMYYGNAKAVAADDAAGSFDSHQALAMQFQADQAVPQDLTAYGNNASQFTGTINPGALIGAGARFSGSSVLTIPDAPSLAMDPAAGWTWSAWVNMDAAQTDAWLLERITPTGDLVLGVDGQNLYARYQDGAGNLIETPHNSQLPTGGWHHVALVLTGTRMAVFIDGRNTAYVDANLPAMQGAINIGAAGDGQHGFVGQLDELRIANVARSNAWLETAVKGEGPAASLLVYGEDGQQDSGGGTSYFAVTLHNVTPDGWVVIVILSIMAAISWVVMISKGLVVNRIRKDNAGFQAAFARLGATQVDDLDAPATAAADELQDSPLLLALSGKHDHFESSNLYRIYHAGVQEMHHRMAKSVGARASQLLLSPQAVDAIRATMDGALTRENQKLNSQMVLLTIAISGGPFLGLLGTVVGVMITFAAIAASGDVNVNSIAPGIAAALVATVAGLAVAIPALFGYNYLGSRIKDISADMHVFVDEFVAKIAEQHS